MQISESNNFAIFLPYRKTRVSDEVDFLYADKHEIFLQIHTKIFDGDCQAFLNFQK